MLSGVVGAGAVVSVDAFMVARLCGDEGAAGREGMRTVYISMRAIFVLPVTNRGSYGKEGSKHP